MKLKFHQRVKKAREHAQLTQTELSRLVSGDPDATNGLIERMENREEGESSLYTPQIAHHCKVSAMWLATGDGEMFLDRSTLSDDAILFAIAWEHLPTTTKQRYVRELIPVALPFIKTVNPMYKPIERWYKQLLRSLDIKAQLAAR